MTTKIQKENRSLEETINASKKLLSSKDKPLDENLTVELKNEVSTAEKKKQVIPKIKKTSDINKQVKSLKKPIIPSFFSFSFVNFICLALSGLYI